MVESKKWKHPEQREGEKYLGNMTEHTFDHQCGWATKRMGDIAYESSGKKITGPDQDELRPVFVESAEIEKAMGR